MADWNELSYILKDSLPSNISEQLYELKVVQAFEKLGWSQYKKEISVRETIQFGAVNRINPDIIIRSGEGQTQFVVEIKRPSEDLREDRFRRQLQSYMRMLKVNLGILIGDKIQIFADGSLMGSESLILIEEVEFQSDSKKGERFAGLFRKDNYSKELITEFINLKLKKKREIKELKRIKNDILKLDSKELKEILKAFLLEKYDAELLEKVLDDINLDISIISRDPQTYISQKKEQFKYIPAREKFTARINPRMTGEKRTKDGMKIGAYVQKTFRELFKDNLLSHEMIDKLHTDSYSKLKLNQNWKVLRTEAEGTKDELGNGRYYAREIFGGKYYLTSQWVETQWEPFLNWVKEVKAN